jgi:hypothetical protein
MDPCDCSNESAFSVVRMTQVVNSILLMIPDMLSCVMSAVQKLLPRRSLAERFAPPVSTPAPSPSALPVVSQGGDPCWANVTANLPNDVSTISSNCGCDGDKNPDANTLFWLDLTIFRMNTCAKRVGGWGADLNSYSNSALRNARAWRTGRSAIAPPARLRYSAAQGSGDNF